MSETYSDPVRLAILRRIINERKRQDDKWGEQNHRDDIWALILGEEFGEVQKAILEVKFNPALEDSEVEEELIQLVAVGVSWLEARVRRQARSKMVADAFADDGPNR